jgi:hypothetical protein
MKVVGFILVVVLCGFLMASATMYLWNWLMPYLFKTPTIDLTQSLGLMALSSLLFYRPLTNSK